MNQKPVRDNAHLDNMFQQQMEVIKQTFNEKVDDSLSFSARFGHLYLVNITPFRSLHVEDFSKATGNGRGRSKIQTSFVPTMLSSQHTASALLNAGFKEIQREESIVIEINNRLKRRCYRMCLDENLMFQRLRLKHRYCMKIDIRRQDRTKPDTRLAVRSEGEELQREKMDEKEMDFAGLLYAHDHLAVWDTNKGLCLHKSLARKASSAKHEVVRSYKLSPDHPSTKLERAITVNMVDAIYYRNRQPDGSFSDREKRTELDVCINGNEELYEVCNEKNFLQNLFQFCDKVLGNVHQNTSLSGSHV